MKNLQQSGVGIINKSEQLVGDYCADWFTISSGISIQPFNFTANKSSRTYIPEVYCTRRNLTELLSERTPFLTEIIA